MSKYDDDEILIRPAKREDMKQVAEMIHELADYEKMSDGPSLSVADLERDGFSDPPAFRCKVAELQDHTRRLVSYALYFPTYSTWEGRSMMLEDLFVRRGSRQRGVGRRMFQIIAKEATDSGCNRLDFHVLENNDARTFYEGLGAMNLTQMEQWCYYRLSGDNLHRLADPTANNK